LLSPSAQLVGRWNHHRTEPTAGRLRLAPRRDASKRLSASSQIASSRPSGQPCWAQSSRAHCVISSWDRVCRVSVGAVESVCSGWPWWYFMVRARLNDGLADRLVREVRITRACRNGGSGTRCGPTSLADPFSPKVCPLNYALRFGRTVWGVVPPAGARGAGRPEIAPAIGGRCAVSAVRAQWRRHPCLRISRSILQEQRRGRRVRLATKEPSAAPPQPNSIRGVNRHKKAPERTKSMPSFLRASSWPTRS
jgi:hypothetical protein